MSVKRVKVLTGEINIKIYSHDETRTVILHHGLNLDTLSVFCLGNAQCSK
jgi:hypothetical protein